jgi:hypothetical protein
MRAAVARALLVCVAAGGGLVAANAKAHAAPSQDAVFLEILSENGIGFGSADAAIVQGHAICYDLDQGYSRQAVVNRVHLDLPLTYGHSAAAVGAAVTAYCPWNAAAPGRIV